MMKKSTLKITLSLLISCLFIGAQAFGQGYAFMVLGAKGGITVDGSAAKVGSTLKSGQEIKTEAGSYLGLAHTSGKTLEIKKKGSFKVDDLVKKITSSSNSLTDQYASFVISELTGGDQVQNRYAQRAKTGSVTRAVVSKPIQFMLPEKTPMLSSGVTIKWYLNEEAELNPEEITGYKYTIKNIFQEVLLEGETDKMHLNLDLSQDKLKDQKQLMYSVVALGTQGVMSPDQMLVKAKDVKGIESSLAEVSNENTVFGQIAKAQVFEEKGLFANAMNAYEKAIELDSADQFKKLYEAFLMRNKLSPEAKKAEN